MKSLKHALILLSLTIGFTANADEGLKLAQKVQEELSPIVFNIPGVNGIGITACDANDGKPTLDYDSPFVYCVLIMTETKSAFNEVLSKFPAGSQYKGVFIVTELTGTVDTYPRASGGN